MLEVHKRERFPLLKASVRFRFGQGTFVEMRSKDRVAPKAAAPVLLGAGGINADDCDAQRRKRTINPRDYHAAVAVPAPFDPMAARTITASDSAVD